MKKFICLLLVSICFLASTTDLFATHNRAGEITYRHDPLPGEKYRYFFEVITYTKTGPPSDEADRDTLDMDWGDGTVGKIVRTNGPDNNGEQIPGTNIKKNIYHTHHTYAGFFDYYVVTMTDPNRITGIININFGDSDGVMFTLIDTLFLLPDEFFGFNDSPILVQPPIDVANRGYPFIHNPNAYDPDGDSLHFELVPPIEFAQGGIFSPVPNYVSPEAIIPADENLPPSGNGPPGPEYQLDIDPNTGEIFWDSPWQTGLYNIAILIKEYRSGFLIGSMIRDMQIEVKEAQNEPPVLAELQDTCVMVGDELILEVSATDADDHGIALSATGFPFDENLNTNPASFSQTLVGLAGYAEGVFEWNPGCDEVFSTSYQVVFKAQDNFAQLPLVDLETWSIQVVAPPPTGLTSTLNNGLITLEWDANYICEDSEKFLGFSVWRSVGCDSLVFDDCAEDLTDFGYELVASQISGNTYTDDSATPGLTYSYRVTADFTDVSTSGGVPLNFGYGLPSNNSCETLPSDVPIITHVDVETTDAIAGSIKVQWTKPNGVELDTMVFTGPYIYELYRTAAGGETLVQSFSSNEFFLANDTMFVDTGLNTLGMEYSYFVSFKSGPQTVGDSQMASSIFLNLNAGDGQIELVWNESVPWINTSYDVYKLGTAGTYDLLANTTEQFYLDQGLVNGDEYCYYVEGIGSYFTNGIVDPLLNKSQRACGVAIDTIPPCNPGLIVSNDCDSDSDEWNFENRLTWSASVGCLQDVAGYRIYFRAPLEIDFQLLTQIDSPTTFQYTHELVNSISGCYYITAFDSFNNESSGSEEICVENCALYELPNAFTPNGDGANEVFTPLVGYRFVNQIDLKIFNRWGGLVFESSDPEINWEGKESLTGKDLPTGVYFYVLRIVEGAGDNAFLGEELSGYVHLLRSE